MCAAQLSAHRSHVVQYHGDMLYVPDFLLLMVVPCAVLREWCCAQRWSVATKAVSVTKTPMRLDDTSNSKAFE